MFAENKSENMGIYAVGADIGGSHISSCLVDLRDKSILKESIKYQKINSKDAARKILEQWVDCLKSTISFINETPVGIGFSFPGPFDYEKGISLVEGVDKFDRLFGLDITSSLISRFWETGIRDFRYVNDAGAFAIGEAFDGIVKSYKRVMALTLGTGLGSGFVVDGQLVTSGDAVPANGWVYNLPFEEGWADEVFSTRWFCKRYEMLTGIRVEGVREIAEKVNSDIYSKQVFQEYGYRLGSFIIPIYTQFGGDIIVLGGNISRAYPLFESSLSKRLQEEGLSIPISVSSLQDNAAMLGAGLLFI